MQGKMDAPMGSLDFKRLGCKFSKITYPAPKRHCDHGTWTVLQERAYKQSGGPIYRYKVEAYVNVQVKGRLKQRQHVLFSRAMMEHETLETGSSVPAPAPRNAACPFDPPSSFNSMTSYLLWVFRLCKATQSCSP